MRVDDRAEQLVDADAGLGRCEDGVVGGQAEHVLDLEGDILRPGGGQVDLVDHRDDLEPRLDGHVRVGDGLGLHALRRIDQQQHALARGQGPRDFVVEIDVAGRVDQVEHVLLAVERVVDGRAVGLDGDAHLAFEVHVVEELLAHLALLDGPGGDENAVGQRAFAVVDVGDDAEVADAGAVEHARGLSLGL